VRQPPPLRPVVARETDLRPEDFWCVPDAANDAKTARVGDSSCELRSSGDVHSCDPTRAPTSALARDEPVNTETTDLRGGWGA
jgi:hypothetical protein